MMADKFSVVLTSPDFSSEPENIEVLSSCLQESLKIIPYDAVRYARDSQGVLVENIPYSQAEDVVAALSRSGIEAGVTDSSVIPQNLEQKKVRAIEVSESGVSVQTGYAGFEEIPWSNISLLSICLYQEAALKQAPEKKTRRKFDFGAFTARAAGGMIGAAVYKYKKRRAEAAKKKMSKKLEMNEIYIADIYTYEPVAIYRIRSNECHYNYLGDRVLSRAEWNFNTVMQDIYNSRGEVLFSPSAGRFIDGDTLEESMVFELTGFDNYNRWLFLAAAAFSNQIEGQDVEGQEPRENAGEKNSALDDFAFE
ncbi:MAG: hypothetical protein ACYTFY_16115 [Planctomycetota bacterium]|jgi:hypothetical protein